VLFGIVTLVGMSLGQMLLELARRHLAALPDRDRADFEDEFDRLRMLRVAEQGLGLGDPMPDFALQDSTGTLRTRMNSLTEGRSYWPCSEAAGAPIATSP